MDKKNFKVQKPTSQNLFEMTEERKIDRAKRTKHEKLKGLVRVLIYSYLDTRTLYEKISLCSTSEMEKVNTSAIIRAGKDFSLKFYDATELEEVINFGKSFLAGMDQVLIFAVIKPDLLLHLICVSNTGLDLLERCSVTVSMEYDYSECAEMLRKTNKAFRGLRIANETQFRTIETLKQR